MKVFLHLEDIFFKPGPLQSILVAQLCSIVSLFGLIAAFFSPTHALYYFLSKLLNFSLSILSISATGGNNEDETFT